MDNKKLAVSTFSDNSNNRRTPIQNASMLPLKDVIGTLFKVDGCSEEKVKDFNDSTKVTKRARYSVRVLSSKAKLPVGTQINIKIKDADCIFTHDDNIALLLGKKFAVVAFDNLNHWFMNNSEGLTATEIRVINIGLQEAMTYA